MNNNHNLYNQIMSLHNRRHSLQAVTLFNEHLKNNGINQMYQIDQFISQFIANGFITKSASFTQEHFDKLLSLCFESVNPNRRMYINGYAFNRFLIEVMYSIDKKINFSISSIVQKLRNDDSTHDKHYQTINNALTNFSITPQRQSFAPSLFIPANKNNLLHAQQSLFAPSTTQQPVPQRPLFAPSTSQQPVPQRPLFAPSTSQHPVPQQRIQPSSLIPANNNNNNTLDNYGIDPNTYLYTNQKYTNKKRLRTQIEYPSHRGFIVSTDHKNKKNNMIDEAFNRANRGENVYLLVFGDHRYPGGGFQQAKEGSHLPKTQEEQIFARTNAPDILFNNPDIIFPIKDNHQKISDFEKVVAKNRMYFRPNNKYFLFDAKQTERLLNGDIFLIRNVRLLRDNEGNTININKFPNPITLIYAAAPMYLKGPNGDNTRNQINEKIAIYKTLINRIFFSNYGREEKTLIMGQIGLGVFIENEKHDKMGLSNDDDINYVKGEYNEFLDAIKNKDTVFDEVIWCKL